MGHDSSGTSLIIGLTKARSTRIEITRLGQTILRPVALGITTRVALGRDKDAAAAGSKIAARSSARMIETIWWLSISQTSITVVDYLRRVLALNRAIDAAWCVQGSDYRES